MGNCLVRAVIVPFRLPSVSAVSTFHATSYALSQFITLYKGRKLERNWVFMKNKYYENINNIISQCFADSNATGELSTNGFNLQPKCLF